MRQLLGMAVFAALIAVFCGCGGSAESESAQLNRARLVGNENIQLNKQLADNDLQIKDLKNKVAALEAENAALSDNARRSHDSLTKRVAELENTNRELAEIVEGLKTDDSQQMIQSLLSVITDTAAQNEALTAENQQLKDQLK